MSSIESFEDTESCGSFYPEGSVVLVDDLPRPMSSPFLTLTSFDLHINLVCCGCSTISFLTTSLPTNISLLQAEGNDPRYKMFMVRIGCYAMANLDCLSLWKSQTFSLVIPRDRTGDASTITHLCRSSRNQRGRRGGHWWRCCYYYYYYFTFWYTCICTYHARLDFFPLWIKHSDLIRLELFLQIIWLLTNFLHMILLSLSPSCVSVLILDIGVSFCGFVLVVDLYFCSHHVWLLIQICWLVVVPRVCILVFA